MKLIQLTQGKFAQVDDEDYDLLMQWNWHHNKGYAVRMQRNELGKQETILMHREIMQTPKGMETDHINANGETDGLNNQRCNLRVCTKTQNTRNRGKPNHNTSGYKGVTWHEQSKKWVARIGFDGTLKNLGSFSDAIDAAQAYDVAARKLFGRFAKKNF